MYTSFLINSRFFLKNRTFLILVFLWGVFLFGNVYPQNDNINAGEEVYSFLKRMQVQGVIKGYDDTILPLTRKEIVDFLENVEKNKSYMAESDIAYLEFLKRKYIISKNCINILDEFPEKFVHNLLTDSAKHLYQYLDSSFVLLVDPVLRYRYIYSSKLRNNSNLFELGGEVHGGYKDWFGFYAYGSNGFQSGNRKTAELDKNVRDSYTFNITGRNNFDFTNGYLNLVKDPFQIELGREQILWGNGYINKMIISDNSQPFDFLKFQIRYKSLRYTFLHAWLVQEPFTIPINDLYGSFKSKDSKYLAISRLEYKPWNSFQISASQLIIYSNRPLELAYLNPFMFWESAQRSLNDLDNSFLAFGSRILPGRGFELGGNIIFDDINFDKLFKGKWAGINNGSGWQIGGFFTYPLLWKQTDIKIEYMQLRPFLYSHPGLPGALTYTNNGRLIGADLEPNSTRLSIEGDYRVISALKATLGFQYTLHGNNIVDENGNLIRNFGGNVFQPVTINDPEYAYLLKGDLEKEMKIYSEIEYRLLFGYYLVIHFEYTYLHANPVENSVNLWGQFKLSFN